MSWFWCKNDPLKWTVVWVQTATPRNEKKERVENAGGTLSMERDEHGRMSVAVLLQHILGRRCPKIHETSNLRLREMVSKRRFPQILNFQLFQNEWNLQDWIWRDGIHCPIFWLWKGMKLGYHQVTYLSWTFQGAALRLLLWLHPSSYTML